jgi:hypothetical protein
MPNDDDDNNNNNNNNNNNKQNKLRVLSPQANYIDRATPAYWRS